MTSAIRRLSGFTLIEVLVVLAILALLLSIAGPRYFGSVERSRETVLKQNLTVIRDALDKYYADAGRYPDTLEELVTKRYLRSAPVDPITNSTTTWIVIAPQNRQQGAIYDVKSGADGKTREGVPFNEL